MKDTTTFESDSWMMMHLHITNKVILGSNGFDNVVILRLNDLTKNTFYVSINGKEIRTSNEPIIDDKYSFPVKIEIKKRVAKLFLPRHGKILFKKVKPCY